MKVYSHNEVMLCNEKEQTSHNIVGETQRLYYKKMKTLYEQPYYEVSFVFILKMNKINQQSENT